MHQLTPNTQLQRVAPDGTAATTFQLAAGTTDPNSAAVDTRDFGGCRFIVCVGAMAAGATLDCKVQRSPDNSTWTDITGAAITQYADTKDDKPFTIDIPEPAARYLRLVFTRGNGGNTTIDAVLAELYNPKNAGTSIHSSIDQRIVVGPNV